MLRSFTKLAFLLVVSNVALASTAQPNILLLVAEDMSPRVGAFGDALAHTPTLDKLAAGGVRYTNVFTTAGVCAPSRAALITGVHQNSLGAGHMRTKSSHWPLQYAAVPDPEVKAFPELLRRAGYYTFTDSKLDYQFSGVRAGSGPATIWDAEGVHELWRGRRVGQPFFGMINFVVTHESMMFAAEDVSSPALTAMRKRAFGQTIAVPVAPADVILPTYYPDRPEIRANLATHYENISRMDMQVEEVLSKLEADGLLANTVVIWTTDHGDGLPRFKREIFDSGIHVPMLVHWPAGMAPQGVASGDVDSRLVSFVDLAPTILQMAGIEIPAFVQGQSFLASERTYIYAARDRMDSIPDRQRAVRDARFKYIRTDYPNQPGYMNLAFRNQLRAMRAWQQSYEQGDLTEVQEQWYRPRGRKALYDTHADPEEVTNLASDPEYASVLTRLEGALNDWQTNTLDLGLVPEAELAERFWPGGVQPLTPAPEFQYNRVAGKLSLKAQAEASIRFRRGDGPWQLYVGEVVIPAGTTITAHAVRYGWRESDAVEFTP